MVKMYYEIFVVILQGVVLNQGMNFIYKSVVFMCCLVGTVAGGVYIWKSLKEM